MKAEAIHLHLGLIDEVGSNVMVYSQILQNARSQKCVSISKLY